MKRSKFTESQIMFALRQNESELKAEANRSRSVTGQANASGRIKKKVLRASQLRGLAMNLIEDYRVSVRRASAVVMLSMSVWY